jgi:hypothetical protein
MLSMSAWLAGGIFAGGMIAGWGGCCWEGGGGGLVGWVAEGV